MSLKKTEKKEKNKPNDLQIRDVWADNFTDEIKILSGYLNKYKHIAMDTEFPGVVYQSQVNTREGYYRTIKTNADKLKLIQVGITITDEEGVSPPGVSTWQFNLKFDLNNDQYSNESIALLSNSGINFETFESRGIPHDLFAEYLMISGLVLNDECHWISFHGIYDFAYFLKLVTNLPLPETENLFFENLKIYFPNFYDIRFLVRFNDQFRGSLSRLGQELNVSRIGIQHQAGSDSLITSEIFFKLKQEYLSEDSTLTDKNILYGIGLGVEDSEINYQSYNNSFKPNTTNINYNNNYDYSNYYQQNLLNMQYSYYRNNPNLYQNNYGFPYNNYNQNGVQFQLNNNNVVGVNNSIQDEMKKKYTLKGIVED